MLEFYMIFSREINKIPTFYTTFARNMSDFYITVRLPEQYLSGIFFWGEGEGEGWAILCQGLGPRPPTS